MKLRVVSCLVGATCVLWTGIGFSQQAPPLTSQISTPAPTQFSDLTAAASTSTAAPPKSDFFTSWDDRGRRTLSQQPSWPIPVVTGSSGLVQCFRYDFVRQITAAETDTWIYGNSKGFNLVPWYNMEFDAAIPSYVQHNSPAARNGWGDFSMLLKYRLAARDAAHGNYSLSVSLGSTLPTGSYKNGSLYATISPTVYAGKGFGRFDVQSTLGATFPTQDTVKLGKVLVWNTVAQYHISKLFWPEVENNASFYFGGKNDGLMQNFVTPGLMVSKFKLGREAHSRLALIFGGGVQIATSQFHTYNHALVFTVRTLF
jgi:hypothetical protein